MCDFCHLHVHSNQSLIDGLSPPRDIIKRAKELGQDSIAITDHGVLSAVPIIYKEGKKEGVNVIAGQEFYIVPDTKDDSFGKNGNLRDRRNFHLTLLAKNEQGYRELIKLSSIAQRTENFFYKPRIDHEILENADTENLICLSGCVSSELSKTFLESIKQDVADCVTVKGKEKWKWPHQDDADISKMVLKVALRKARGVMNNYRSMFPEGQFFYEFMYHDLEIEGITHKHLLPEAKRQGIPVVLTNDSHYAEPERKQLHDVLMCMQWKDTYNPKGIDEKNLDICSADDLRSRLDGVFDSEFVEEGIDNSLGISEMCSDFSIRELDKKTFHIPNYISNKGAVVKSPERLVRKKAKPMLDKLTQDEDDETVKEYLDRFEYEMEIIGGANFYNSFLITEDYVNWARDKGIAVGAGRGSAAGSLVAYCLRITDIDPIRHDLLFERFMNPDRPTMPDFDIDFQSSRIDEVFEYIENKYGKENTLRVCAYTKMKARSLVKSMFTALGVMSAKELGQMSASIEQDVEDENDTEFLTEWLESNSKPVLAKKVKDSPYPLEDFTKRVHGLPSGISAHAAAIVISDSTRPLEIEVPTQLVASSKRTVTQFDMDQLEEIGLVKFDILGLKGLDTTSRVYNWLGRNQFEEEIKTRGYLTYDDAKTFELISSIKTDGVFQLMGDEAKNVLRKIGGCRNFKDIVDVMALGRPGAMRFATRYARNRDMDWEDVELAHEDLKSILRKSYGVILFQEDVIKICFHLGMSNEDVLTKIMKAIKKKDAEIFADVEPRFFEACKDSGWTEEQAADVWDQIKDYAGYGFNMAHATSYADLAYKMAYMKANHPAQFIAARMEQAKGVSKPDKRMALLHGLSRDAKMVGIEMYSPCVNESGYHFYPESDVEIRVGLTDVRDVGSKAAKEIIKNRPYEFEDFEEEYETVGPRGGKKKIGARLGNVRSKMCNSRALMNLMWVGAIPELEIEGSWFAEKNLLGFTISDHPHEDILDEIREIVYDDSNERELSRTAEDFAESSEVEGQEHKFTAQVGGILQRFKEHSYKRKGKPSTMCFLDIELDDRDFNVIMFQEAFKEHRHLISEGAVVLLTVDITFSSEYGISLIATDEVQVWGLEDV